MFFRLPKALQRPTCLADPWGIIVFFKIKRTLVKRSFWFIFVIFRSTIIRIMKRKLRSSVLALSAQPNVTTVLVYQRTWQFIIMSCSLVMITIWNYISMIIIKMMKIINNITSLLQLLGEVGHQTKILKKVLKFFSLHSFFKRKVDFSVKAFAKHTIVLMKNPQSLHVLKIFAYYCT